MFKKFFENLKNMEDRLTRLEARLDVCVSNNQHNAKQIDRIYQQIKEDECEHTSFRFIEGNYHQRRVVKHAKVCKDCGKVLERYLYMADFEKAKEEAALDDAIRIIKDYGYKVTKLKAKKS